MSAETSGFDPSKAVSDVLSFTSDAPEGATLLATSNAQSLIVSFLEAPEGEMHSLAFRAVLIDGQPVLQTRRFKFPAASGDATLLAWTAGGE
jgi:hypothetical protein